MSALFRRSAVAVWSSSPVGRGVRFPVGDLQLEVTGLGQHAAAVGALVAAELHRAVSDGGVSTVTVRLVREPDNPQDGNAVAVYADPHGLVGHLDRDDARTFGPLLDEHVRFTRTPVDVLAAARLVRTPGEPGRPDVALRLLLPEDLGTRPL